jgi:hypothetical protein
MKLTMLAAAAAIGLGAILMPAASQASPMAAMPAVTAPHAPAVEQVACHWHRHWVGRHRGPHGHWHRGHWHRYRVCH